LAPRLIHAVRAKTAGSHVALRENFSGLVSATDAVKRLGKSYICTWKKTFGGVCGFYMSDVISGGLLGHLGPLHLALGPNW